MRITWDEEKSQSNLAKHGVSFDRAKLVFDDPWQLSQLDPCEDEERWQTLGLVNGVVILMVVHTVKEQEHEEEEIRIISARKATRIERKAYENSHEEQ
jgi:uncharacterized DUF497 family protein